LFNALLFLSFKGITDEFGGIFSSSINCILFSHISQMSLIDGSNVLQASKELTKKILSEVGLLKKEKKSTWVRISIYSLTYNEWLEGT
jgi:hypothetical protein